MSLFDESERRPLSVSELTAQVRGALENRFASVWVEGEISNFRAAASGHWYFTVRDEGAQLRATCFRGVNCRIRFRPSDGLLVRVRGRMTVYEPRGDYELMVEALDPVGAGALRVAFEQLKERLAAEGLFDEASKRELPILPRRVGVVTSPAGAALRDIIHAVERRTRTVSLLVAPTRVQGEGAGTEIARAIRALNEHHLRALAEGRAQECVDVIIVGRGGGSTEDLWAFNEEEVARAIRASLLPVISAVGHETDFTIADFAADVRAATPTAAAELVAEREDEIADYVERLTSSLVNAARYRVLAERARVQEAAMSAGFDEVRMRLRVAREELQDARRGLERRVVDLTARARRRLEAAARRLQPARMAAAASRSRVRLTAAGAGLESASRSRLEEARSRLAVAAASLEALSPLAVLGRGYALALDGRGEILRAASSVSAGERVRVRLGSGALRCRVEEVEAGRAGEGEGGRVGKSKGEEVER
jgi:exodeoxyribonuclease VII large subunit